MTPATPEAVSRALGGVAVTPAAHASRTPSHPLPVHTHHVMSTDTHDYERLDGGVAQLATDTSADDADVYRPEIVPIGEGDITVGLSGTRTVWDRETLRDAVKRGAFDNAKLLKGRAGEGHKPFGEQAAPGEIVGDAGTFRYEAGRGPVSNGDGSILDEHLAQLIDHGLVEVSPDMTRELGEYDDDRDAYRVEEIQDVPYITILDKGASESAAIEPARAEALGFTPDSDPDGADVDVEQLAATHTPDYSGTSDGREWEKPAQSDFDTDDLGEIAGHFLASETGFPPDNYGDLLLPVVAPDGTLVLDALDSAWQMAAQTDGLTDDDVETVKSTIQRLVREEFDEAFGEDDGTEQNSPAAVDEPAESGTGTQTTPTDTPDDMSDDDTPELAELREQLEAKTDTIEDLEAEVEQLQADLEAKESTIEDTEERLGTLEEENRVVREVLAEHAAGDSPLPPERLAEKFDTEELAEMLAAGDDEADADADYMETVREQLATSPAVRGEDPDDGTEQLGEEQLAAANERARGVLALSDVRAMEREQLSPREYVQREHDTDPAQYDSAQSLRAAIKEAE